MKLIEIFDRVYIVNLPERSDRRREIEAELRRLGLQVDGERIRFHKAVRPDDAGLFPSLGARGCFLSHLAILNDAIECDLEKILVMEDDLCIAECFARAQAKMSRRLEDKGWWFAYLGHVQPPPDDEAPPRWQACWQPIATTHFYALNRVALRPLRDHLQACLSRPPGHPLGSPMHVDGAYSLFRAQHPEALTLIATPSLGGQRSSRSDIYPNKWYDRTPGLMQLSGAMRVLKNLGLRAISSARKDRPAFTSGKQAGKQAGKPSGEQANV